MNALVLVLRDAQRTLQARVGSTFAQAVVAALSADPDSLDELELALGRYAKPPADRRLFADFAESAAGPPAHGNLLLIDLPARLVVSRGRHFTPQAVGEVTYLEHDDSREVVLGFRLSDEWLLKAYTLEWELLARQRRDERAALPRRDVRAVLYGRLPEFVARETQAARKLSLDDPVREIHERWLMTARDDLAGLTPRQVLLARHEQVDREISARAWEWSVLGACQPPLPLESAAARAGGFGTHELVLYYDLVRHLLAWAWCGPVPDDVCDLDGTTRWLTELRDTWLDTPDLDTLHGRTPRHVIDQERRRIPWAVSPEEAIVDHDCPICRMMAEQRDTPVFCHLDASGFDEGFVFSLCATREQWEREEAEWAEYVSRLSHERVPQMASDRLWRNSHFETEALDSMAPGQQLGLWQIRLLAHLSELREDARDSADERTLVDQALARVEDFRQALRDRAGWLAEACLDEAAARLLELAARRDDLQAKCTDVRRSIQILRQSCAALLFG